MSKKKRTKPAPAATAQASHTVTEESPTLTLGQVEMLSDSRREISLLSLAIDGMRFINDEGLDVEIQHSSGQDAHLALLAANQTRDIWAVHAARQAFTTPALPLGVVLTTTGTGTEVNGGFVIRRRADNEKVAFSSLSTRPRFAYCNPDYTITLPPQVLADNYTDILSHLLEQYFSMEDSTGIVDSEVWK